MARLSLVFLVATLAGCAVYGGAGTAKISDRGVDARGTGVATGIDADGPYARSGTRRIIVE